MGYNTAAIILNDGMDTLASDPEAGKKIHRGMLMAHNESQTISIGNHCNPMMVLPPQHADVNQVVIVGGNYIRPAFTAWSLPHNCTDEELNMALLKELADQLGYSLRKKK